jgi:hypothetical protein
MEDKVYRQRRNLMITCIGIILFYMGPGDFNEIGLLKNLGLHTLETWQLKAMILVMYLYYAWRYYQYCSEHPSQFFFSVRNYLMDRGKFQTNLSLLPQLSKEIHRLKSEDPGAKYELGKIYSNVCMTGLMSEWEFFYDGTVSEKKVGSLRVPGNSSHQLQISCGGKDWFLFKLKIIFTTGFKFPGFTDWIMPWLFFWLTWGIIIWNEFICTAWQLATM